MFGELMIVFIAILSFFSLSLQNESSNNNPFFLKKEFSLVKPYSGSWDFSGQTIITSEYVRLTSSTASQLGAVWCSHPVTMRSWEVHLQFRIHGSTGSLFGDGMAFWYVDPATQFSGPVFGVQDHFRGLAVFLDTYSNHNGPHAHDHPYISSMVNNGSFSYDHDKDGTHTQLAGCSARVRNRDHDTLLAISYNGDTLTVSTDIDNKGIWELCFRVAGVRLPTHFIFGVSAMTGELVDTHDLLSFKAYELDAGPPPLGVDYKKIEPSAENAESPLEHVDQDAPARWSILRIFLVVFCILALVAAAIGAYIFYTHKEANKKRFY